MPTCIVVADNNPLTQDALRDFVRYSHGLQVVVETTDAGAALELCGRFRPDLVVLMGTGIPQMNSLLELTSTIRRELPRTAALILNGYGDPNLLAEAIRAGASGYILKTATPQQITDAVRRTLEGVYAFDQALATKLLLRLLDKPDKGSHSQLRLMRPSRNGEGALAALTNTLTQREAQVLRLVAKGYTNCQIARGLRISVSTAKKHVQRATFKLGVSSRTEAAIKALELDLLGDKQV